MQDLVLGVLSEFAERQRSVPLKALLRGVWIGRWYNPDTANAARDQRRKVAKFKGLCIECREAPRVDASHCELCRDQSRANARALRERRPEMCATCRVRPKGATSRCEPCRAERNARTKELRNARKSNSAAALGVRPGKA